MTLKAMTGRSGREDYLTVMSEEYEWTDTDGVSRTGPDLAEAWDLPVGVGVLSVV